MKVGFIGLGIMGAPMAGHLQKGGHELFLHDLAPDLPAHLLQNGAVACGSNRDVAEQADVIILMVPDTPDTEAVLFGANGVSEGLGAGKLVIDMSSISPTATTEFAARINDLGCLYLDAPVSGGVVGAENAKLTIMAGGPQEAFDRAMPLFELMGGTVTLIGTRNGDGQVCKACNQIVVGVTVQAVAEALVLAAKAGTDPAIVRQALMGGAASSMILENHGARMIEGNFEPGFRAELQQKDLNVVLSAARDLGVVLPLAATAESLYNALNARGQSKADHSAVVTVLEDLASCQVSSKGRGQS
ncbi:MAG: 2-hydroxy-3-oxopropionate reductase [Alphaproteobacteria bacterium]|jgi:2-hydroxy-3-oxopropionate reductase|nr:2-hydroxy-3-oxopropionate reductase [Rhodospirillaceae bacterium]MDP6022764.1 2-hydroxy-3-oxopropionate reductase [Alphaproteobacteria bacterium]MDP6255124.1 2-hydroxy-3-oxopropionate reductase [Alphaproteobacteria bacterium]MDP7055586.1 2-hydroxy-3-oxopropionate reductase [Alphaproteobacteria bacterium]MDP7229450.1 2-hydroxy-3-oxopropionate reductase [Alphaproteobacteria bacterium]